MGSTLGDRTIGRVLIVRPSALGDVARTVPALVTLRQALPRAQIDWLVHDDFVDAVAHHPSLDGVVPFARRRFATAWRNGRAAGELYVWLRQLRRNRYDLVVDLQGLLRSGLFTRQTAAPIRLGFANAREMGHLAYNRRYFVDPAMHSVDRMLQLLESGGYGPSHDMRLYVGKEDLCWLDDYLRANDMTQQPYTVVAPTARWTSKCWPIGNYIDIARRLLDRKDVGERLVILAAPREQDTVRPLVTALENHALCPTTTVGQMMALISRARLLVCNDSAPMHMAVGFDRPLAAIFGPTDPALVGPYHCSKSVVQPPNLEQATLSGYRRQRNDQSLISQVTIDQVWQTILSQLDLEP